MKKIETRDALLEIGAETLPARFISGALEDLKRLTLTFLGTCNYGDKKFTEEDIDVFGSPMRLALIIRGLPAKTEAKTETLSGPPARLLKDETGAYTKQALGFARKYEVAVEDLTTASTEKGEFLAVEKTTEGLNTVDILSAAFPSIIRDLKFPKSMVWEESKFRFARPLRTLVALYGKTVVKFSIAGVRSGSKTRGLAALGAPPVAVTSPDGYVKVLRDKCVIVDPQERRDKLVKSLRQAAKRAAGTLDEDAELIERTVWLTEHPAAVLGSFDKGFLSLPRRLVMMVLKKQLMFFPVLGKDGALVSDFLGVRDGVSEGQKDVQAGYERVLEARLSDAAFYIGRDKAGKLEDKLAMLERVGFQKGLGSMGDKARRVEALSSWIAERLLQHRPLDCRAVAKTARLAYADLVTGVVGEFPELQGVMGGVYARHEGLDEKIALGIEEFYLPDSAKAPLPALEEGCVVSLAGKLDTIAAMFSAGFVPSGSEDPFGLRRQGNGVIRILLERQLPLSGKDLIAKAAELLGGEFDREKTRAEVEEFLWQRLETLLQEKGFKADEIRSVKDDALERLAETYRRILAVKTLRGEPDFLSIAQAFKRASNIITKSAGGASGGDVEKELLREEPERDLFGALCRVEGEVREKVSQGLYEDGLRSLVGLKPQVDRFFDKVLVMAEDEGVKNNRLSLLSRLVRLFKTVADISHIQN